MRDYGPGVSAFVPGFVRKHVRFWHEDILKGQALRDKVIPYLRDGFQASTTLQLIPPGVHADRFRTAWNVFREQCLPTAFYHRTPASWTPR